MQCLSVLLLRRSHRLLISLFIPLADWNHEKQIAAVRKPRNVRHPIRSVVAERLQFLLILMRAYDHDVRADMEVPTLRRVILARLVRDPCAVVHVRNPDRFDVRLATGKAVFEPLQENRIKAGWLVT
jgi:hypothetical protein